MKSGLIQLVAMILISVNCYGQLLNLDIGKQLPSSILKDVQPIYTITSSGAITPTYELFDQEIKFNVGVDRNKYIKHISTNDLNFETDENIKIGMTLQEVSKQVNKLTELDIGYAWYISLPSGWNAAFALLEFDSRSKINDDAIVTFFFKK